MAMSYLKRVLQPLEVTRDTDTDVNSYVNNDTRPLPPPRRTYGPWNFVALCKLSHCPSQNILTLFRDGYGLLQRRRMDNRLFPHLPWSQCLAINAGSYTLSNIRWFRVHYGRSPRCIVAHWISLLDAFCLGNVWRLVPHGQSSVLVFHLHLDQFLVRWPMCQSPSHGNLAFVPNYWT